MQRTARATDDTRVTEAQTVAESRSRAVHDRALPAYEVGDILADRYRVVGLLGQGGFGEVYEVRDSTQGDRPLALKVARLETADSRALNALRSEFALLATLTHPNLAEVFDFGHLADDIAFFTQQLVSGKPLGTIALRSDNLEHFPLWAQLCHALDYLHARGILHGDIKPSNIIVDEDEGRLTLLDFGISRAFGGRSGREMVGTFSYMSPEAITGAPVDARGDLYSLGITLYRLATGRLPFRGTSTQVLTSHLTQPLPPLPAGSVSEEVAKVIVRLTSKEPGARYASANEALSALARATGAELPPEPTESLSGYLLSGKLVGQQACQEQLRAHVAQPARGQTAILVGDSGTGKSRLLREARQHAQLSRRVWIGVSANARWAQKSLVPDIARAALNQDVIDRLPEDVRVELSRALPELRLPRQQLGVPLDPERARRDRVRALARGIQLRFEAAPGVIAVEDLHRVDASVLELLELLVRECQSLGVQCTFVLTTRPGEVEKWSRSLDAMRLQVGRLDWASTRSLLDSMFGSAELVAGTQLGESFEREPHTAQSVQESLRLALEEGGIVRSGGSFVVRGPLPALGLSEVLSRRARRRSAMERRVGLALALLAGERTAAELQQVSGGKREATVVALRALVRAGLVEERFDPRVRAAYTMHDRHREAWAAASSASATRAMHRRAGRMLAKSAREDWRVLFEAAEHFAAGEQVPRALAVLERAADKAQRAGRPDQAVLALMRSHELRAPEATELLRLFDLCRTAGMRAEMESVLARLRALGDSTTRAAAVLRQARLFVDAGAADQAREALAKANAACVGQRSALETAEFELETARVEDEFGELSAGRCHYEAAGEAARQAKSRGTEAQAWLGASLIALRAGDTAACGEFATRALGAAREAKQPVLVSDALRNMGNAARETGAARRALALYRRAVAAARGAGSPEAEAKALNNLGTVCQWLGLLPEAVSSMERSLELKERLGLSASALLTLNNLGGCFIAIGRLDDAEAQLTRVAQAAGAKQPVVVALAKSNLGDLFVLRGEIKRALGCYREAHDDNRQRGIAVQDSHAISGIIRCLLLRDAEGDLAEAQQLLQRFGALSGVDDLAEARWRAATTEAAVLDRAGDPKAALASARRARKNLVDALQWADVFGTHLEALWLEAILLQRLGRSSAATKAVSRAQALLRKLSTCLPSEERQRFETFHPLHEAIRSASLDVAPGRSWPAT